MSHRTWSERAWLLFTLVLATALCLAALHRGWDAVGEGALAQSAERVLNGEVPHRDFAEIYTGLLTLLNALAFAVGGVSLSILRIPLLLLAIGWVAALFALARRFVPPAGASLLTLLALVWSFPNSPSPMPSWYNLFLATFGVLALVRWIEDRKVRWLVLAGFLGAASFLIKLSGLFFLAGAGLFLVEASRPAEEDARPDAGTWMVRVAVTLLLAGFVLVLWRSIAARGTLGLAHFFVPIGFVILGLVVREWTAVPTGGLDRARSLVRALGPFAIGGALAVLPFALWFFAVDGLPAAVEGVFLTSFRRVARAGMQPPRLQWLLSVAPLVILLRPRPDHDGAVWRFRSLIVAALLLIVLIAATRAFAVERVVLHSVRFLAPVIGLCTAAVLAVPAGRLGCSPEQRLLAALLGIVAVFHNLIQFPFSGPAYFFYAAPLIFLGVTGVVTAFGRTPRGLQLGVAGFYLAFAVLEVLPGSASGLRLRAGNRQPPVPVNLARADLLVAPGEAALYRDLIPFVQERARDGAVWAGPEAPEVYFFGGFRNRTRALYDFLEESDGRQLLSELDLERTRVIVINTQPGFSRPLPASLLEELATRFPNAETLGRFLVRWR